MAAGDATTSHDVMATNIAKDDAKSNTDLNSDHGISLASSEIKENMTGPEVSGGWLPERLVLSV